MPKINETFGVARFFRVMTRGLAILIVGSSLAGCATYASMRYAGWDAKVKECETDGGVTVYERVTLGK
jgi:hypothetical protein